MKTTASERLRVLQREYDSLQSTNADYSRRLQVMQEKILRLKALIQINNRDRELVRQFREFMSASNSMCNTLKRNNTRLNRVSEEIMKEQQAVIIENQRKLVQDNKNFYSNYLGKGGLKNYY